MVKQKVAIGALICCLAVALLGIALFDGGGYGSVSYAEDSTSFARLQVDELPGYAADGATVVPTDSKSGVSFNVGGYGRIGFNGNFGNVEITSILNFSTIGNTTFILRAQGKTLCPAGDAGWTNKGYYFRWYGHGQFDFVKDTTVVTSAAWGPIPAPVAGTDYVVKFKAVNNADGTAQITVSINDTVFVNYTDQSDVISSGWFAICSEGSVFNVRGNGFEQDAINLADVASPIGSSNFPATIKPDGSVDTNRVGVLGVSGAGYIFQTTDSYAIKTKFTPNTKTGNISLTIGAKKSNQAEMNRPMNVDPAWGWSEPGYTLTWSANGQRHIYRSDPNTPIDYLWCLPEFIVGTEYTLEFGYKHLDDGSNLLYLFIDDILKTLFVDRANDDYTPLAPVSSGVPADLLTYSLVVTNDCEATITPLEKTQYEQKTLVTKDMGVPATIPTMMPTLDRNNSVSAFGGGVVAGYTTETANQVVRFNANFTSVGSNIAFMSRAQGALDTPWGGGWTNKGYVVYLYPNGQLILSKNGATLCEGWATGGFSFVAEKDYLIEIGTINVSDSAVRFFVNVDGVCVANYVDTVSPIKNSGTFAIYSTGMAGSLKQYGYAVPQINAPATAQIGDNVSLDYTMEGKDSSDEVTYYIDETASTARGRIADGKLVPGSEGKLSLYVCVNGIYGSNYDVTVEGTSAAVIPTLVVPQTVRIGETVDLDYEIENKSPSDDVTYHIDSAHSTATATITGNRVVASAVGKLSLYVSVNGIASSSVEVSVKEALKAVVVGIPTAPVIVGGQQFTADGKLNDDSVQIVSKKFRVINGSGKAVIDEDTGAFTAVAAGSVAIVATVNGIESVPYQLSVSPKVEIGDSTAMAVGATRNLSYTANCELPDENIVVRYQLIEGSEYVTLNQNTGVAQAVKIGVFTVRVYVTGETFQAVSEAISVAIEAPVVVLRNVKDMVVGQSQTLLLQISDGVEIKSKSVEVVLGDNLVEVNGDTVRAVQEGSVKLKAVINGYESVVYTMVITKLTPTLIAPQQLFYNSEETLKVAFNSSEYTPSKIVYTIVSGQESAVIEGDVLKTTDKAGTVQIQASIDDGLYVASATIKVVGKVAISGITANQQVYVGTSFDVAYLTKFDGEITSVTYELINSDGLATLTLKPLAAGQTEKDRIATITILKAGNITLRVTVNNEYVDEVVFQSAEQANVVPQAHNYWWIFIVVGVVVVVAAVVVTVILIKRKKKRS